jgi:hypothetical protein
MDWDRDHFGEKNRKCVMEEEKVGKWKVYMAQSPT